MTGNPSMRQGDSEDRDPAALLAEEVNIAYCRTHGLHGARAECFVCGDEAIQVPMVHASQLAQWKGAFEGLAARERELLDERLRVRRAIVNVFSAYMADEPLAGVLNELENAAGLAQQEGS